jgi:2-methylcitrate dehydratase PrpD
MMALYATAREPGRAAGEAVTALLAEQAVQTRLDELPDDVIARARLCLLDWIGVSAAASGEPVVRIVRAQAEESGGRAEASLVASGSRLPATAAAFVNGSASHALDYDDAHLAMIGHPSAAVLAALTALAERERVSGAEVLAAFVAGYECTCRVGVGLGPSHYARGFHTTATAGTIGAAVACARLLGLDVEGTINAIAIASTQAAGQRTMFGTMVKPMHVGFAASRGLFAALLAQRGVQGCGDALEARLGLFAQTSDDADTALALSDPPNGFYLRDGLFKYHACCFLTHAPAGAAQQLRARHGFATNAIDYVVLRVHRAVDTVCNISVPRDGLEMKFSVRAVTALALAGQDTGALETFSERMANDVEHRRLLERVRVELTEQPRDTACELEVALRDGRIIKTVFDAGVPTASLDELTPCVMGKFLRITTVFGPDVRKALVESVMNLEQLAHFDSLAALWRLNRVGGQ